MYSQDASMTHRKIIEAWFLHRQLKKKCPRVKIVSNSAWFFVLRVIPDFICVSHRRKREKGEKMAKQKLEGENAGIGQLYQHFGFVQEYLSCFLVAQTVLILQYHGLGDS
jgi:hypothetical protein